jgi:PEP-CTERM motif
VYGLVEPGVFAANIRIQDSPTAVPEPASMLLIGSGLATLAIRRRRGGSSV